MTFAAHIPPTLADSDGVVKLVLFGLAALVWVVAQVGSAVKSQAKKRQQQLDSGDFAPDPSPPRGPRGRRPAQTRLERQLAERKREAVQFREERVAPPAVAAAAPALTYEQVRQSRQAPPRPKQKPVPRPQPARPAARPPAAAGSAGAPTKASEGPATRVGKRFRADIGSTEIGSAEPDRRTAAQRRVGLAALLQPASLRDVIAASEILKPPLALRTEDDDRSR